MRTTTSSLATAIVALLIIFVAHQSGTAEARPSGLYDALISGSREFLRTMELFDSVDDDDDEASSYDATGDYLDRQQRVGGGGKPSRSTSGETASAAQGVDAAQERCTQPMRQGHCRALIPRWRYDMASRQCREFKFGGCDGNGNNFGTQRECEKICGGL